MNKPALYAFLLFIFFTSYSFIIFLEKIEYEEVIYNNSSDGIAVLTGGKGRISLGLELFKSDGNLKLIISGVDKKVSDKSIIPDNLRNKANITIDKDSESTYQNAKVINNWIAQNKLKNVTIISSYYHMPRSMLLIQAITPSINFYAYPVKKIHTKKISFKENIFYYFFLVEEYIKYIVSHYIIFIK